MSRINTNVPSIVAQRVLNMQNERLTTSLQRLSTGLRINQGKDDPAGLIASEQMRTEMVAIEASQRNITRATQVVAVAESGLSQITEMLKDLEQLVDLSSNDAAITDDERAANQLEIDAILESIDRVANSTELQGRKLLNGSLAYTTSAVTTSQIAHLGINSARVPNGGFRSVTVDVVQSAQLASLAYTSGTITGATRTIEVTGKLGIERFTFASGTTNTQIRDAINQSTELTGVSAYASGANYVYFTSTEYGGSEFVKVRELTGASFALTAPQDYGRDATVVVNGETTQADGLKVSVRTSALAADITLTVGLGTQTAVSSTFYITGGGATFAISPTLDLNAIAPIGIDQVTSSALGNGNTGYLYSLVTGGTNAIATGNYFTAQRIIRSAVSQVASLRGRLGAFEKSTLSPTLASLQVQYENVAAAESTIRDTDFAQETANLTRAQILVQAASMVLRNANTAPQNVLALLQ